MIESVVALLMFVNGEIKEHRIQENMAKCLRGKRQAERQYSASVKYQCWKAPFRNLVAEGKRLLKKLEKN